MTAVRVRLTDHVPATQADPAVEALLEGAVTVPGEDDVVGAALRLARELGAVLPSPGAGETLLLWESLATLGALDLTVARVVEPHLDALAILGSAPATDPTTGPATGPAARPATGPAADLPEGATLGVYAAEGPGTRLEAAAVGDRVALTGRKPWCSLADRVSHALVTAWVDEQRRGLFLVDLGLSGVQADGEAAPWVAHGLARVTSGGLLLEAVPAVPVGPPGWYLDRPGFAWGGMGVAAVWYGGAVAVAVRVHLALSSRPPDQVGILHLGTLDASLHAARLALLHAAARVDSGRVSGAAAARLCLQVRQTVADTVETVLRTADHALGPGPLALEEEHARRVSDLRMYLRQHHGERDTAALGRAVLESSAATAQQETWSRWW